MSKERILEIVSQAFNIEKNDLQMEMGPDDVEDWDSITHMEMISVFEDEFDVELDVDEITEMETVQLILDTLAKHGVKI